MGLRIGRTVRAEEVEEDPSIGTSGLDRPPIWDVGANDDDAVGNNPSDRLLTDVGTVGVSLTSVCCCRCAPTVCMRAAKSLSFMFAGMGRYTAAAAEEDCGPR